MAPYGVNGILPGDGAATPLTPEEREGLILGHITQRNELNEFEQRGVEEGDRWSFSRRRDLLSERFVRTLHKRMFGRVWRWAGTFRKTERNIGVDPAQIPTQLRLLLDDTRYWIEHKTYGPDEICVRFHHRLVTIHPFANGNGRHARLMADLFIVHLGGTRFTWGRANLVAEGDDRQRYIAARRAADEDPNDIEALLIFARS